MSSYTVTIPITPKPKGVWSLGKYGTYNPSARGQKQTLEHVKKQLGDISSLKGPLLVIVHYQLPAPQSLSMGKRKKLHLLPHPKRPDGDNLEKFLNDALNGYLWEDDARIAFLFRTKTYTYKPEGRTTLFVRELPFEVPDYQQILSDITQHLEPHDY